jgi:ribonuclease P protein component
MGQATGRFERSDRLLDSKDFRRVMRRGQRRAHQDLVVITTNRRRAPDRSDPSSEPVQAGSRLGITASRKVGCAVVRNRFKRHVREWFRTHRCELANEVDLVVIARRSGAQLSWSELDERLRGLLDLGSARPAAEPQA